MNNVPANSTAGDFAKYIAEHKPYLIEIEDEIQNVCRGQSEGKIKIEIHIRGKNVVMVDFWSKTQWKLNKLT